MRGFLIVTAAVLVAIAIGVAIEWSSPSAVPPVLAQAIARTIAVRSAEVTQTFPLPNATAQVGTGIYNAPDLWQGAFSPIEGSIQTRAVVVGTKEYVVEKGNTRGLASILGIKQPIATMHDANGNTPAQEFAFFPLIDALQGSGFHDVSGLWSFHLNLGYSTVRVTGGTIEISDGVVTKATTTELQSGHRLNFSWAFTHLNSAPRIVIPPIAKVTG